MADLVIVESPTKAKTLSRFLGKGFRIASSFGHVRDLPKSKIGVDVEHDFAPQYVVPLKSKKVVTALKQAAARANVVYFATDEDREGEAISWHLAQLLGADESKLKRITFHEITETAITEALRQPRALDLRLVDAQQARRILDRLVGYELSPFLWKKVARGLSAGRVQSVAVRLVVEREREIQAFKAQEYWTLDATFATDGATFTAQLRALQGKQLGKFDLGSEKVATVLVEKLKGARYRVAGVTRKQTSRNPLPPYTTSTLQQDANRRLGFSARQTMTLAQMLYEGVDLPDRGSTGLITYMRTDSLNLAQKFLDEAREYISKHIGRDKIPPSPRRFKTKSRSAQEAHEAIRPTEVEIHPDQIKNVVEPRMHKLYDLVWRRAVASQMTPAILEATAIDVATDDDSASFRATGQRTVDPGYTVLYPDALREVELPKVSEGQNVNLADLKPLQHFTEPPARYSEAGLVKALEEHGIGRPSTYAPTIATIVERGYVVKEERRLKPTDIAFLVNDLLVKHFPEIVDYAFTAHLEEELDEIAEGTKQWVPVLREFYTPFKANLEKKDTELSKKELTETKTDIICEVSGHPMVVKYGRFGKFLACTGYPECRNTKPLNADGTPGERPKPEGTGEKCPECGKGELVRKVGRFGPFLSCSRYPDCKYIKNIEKGTGVTCPECGKGQIVEKRSRRGKVFYSCNRYPDCKFALWSKPTGEKCPETGDLLVYGKNGTVVCSNRACKFTKQAETKAEESDKIPA
jgi:DNA topoisomerase-1